MVKGKWRGLSLGICLLLSGCEFFGESGGGSSNETESTLAGQIRYADKRPVVSAKVTLVLARALGDTLPSGSIGFMETVTDIDGGYSFGGLANGVFHLEARMDGDGFSESHSLYITVPEKPQLIVIPPQTLTQSLSTKGSLVNQAGASEKANLSFYGSNRKTITDSLGNFALLDIAAGIHILRITPVNPGLGSLEMGIRAGMNLGRLSLSGSPVIRVSDFDDPLLETPFSSVFGKGHWYAQDIEPCGIKFYLELLLFGFHKLFGAFARQK